MVPKEIDIARDIVKNYEPKDVVNYLTKKLKQYNRGDNASTELQMYIDVLSELNAKMNKLGDINVV